MINRGIFSRGPCASPINCGFGLNSRKKVYSGTGGRGTITRGDVLYGEAPVAARSDSQQFTHYDNSPIELKEESQYHPVIEANEHVENPQSFEVSGAQVGPLFHENDVNSSNLTDLQILQMNTPVTTGQEYNNTFPNANSSFGQTHDAYNAKKIYPVMTKSHQEYQDTYPKTLSASSWNVPSQANGMNETDLYMNNAPVQELHGTSNAVSMEPRGFSVDNFLATQNSQQFDFHDSSAISFDASITEPITSQTPQSLSWDTSFVSQSRNDQWTSQQGYQVPSHSANAFTNLPAPTTSSFDQAHHTGIGQSFGSSGNQNLATGIDMDEDARILAQKAGG